MVRTPFRAGAPAGSRRIRASARLGVLAPLAALSACVSYEPAPVDVALVLDELNALRIPGDERAASSADALGPAALSAFAVTHHPELRAARARVGVARALLVEAGLLADPELSWDGMDALAAELVEDGATTVDFVSGFGLSVPLPRPGERAARRDAARWRVEEQVRELARAEWALARDVHVACEDVLEAEALRGQNRELLAVAETTRGYFERARDAGAATAIQANLASGDLLSIRADGVRLDGRVRAARARLNALLGLPPAAEVPLGAAEEPAEPAADAEELVRAALARRPDLAVLLASYAAAEEDVRLAVARQFPQIAIGTGIAVVPGLFSGFNHAAIEAAVARRAALREEVTVLVHELRGDVWDARLALDEARREVDFLTAEVLPNAEESLRLAGEAFDAGEVTLLEILSLQHALVDARTRTTEARAEQRRRRWKLAAASGTLLGERRTEELEEGGTGS